MKNRLLVESSCLEYVSQEEGGVSGREGGRRGGRGKGAIGVVKSLLGRIHVCAPGGARKGSIGEPGAGGRIRRHAHTYPDRFWIGTMWIQS